MKKLSNKLAMQLLKFIGTLVFVFISICITYLIDSNPWFILVADVFFTLTAFTAVYINAAERKESWFTSMVLSCIASTSYAVAINGWIVLITIPMLVTAFIIVVCRGINEYFIEEEQQRQAYFSY